MYSIVVGLGFGDEGKGRVVDYLVSQVPKGCGKPRVVRFSGGQHAGHTVVHNGIRHVFSNVGSGALAGAPTYWGSLCTFDPIGLCNELDVLASRKCAPKIYVDKNCPVTTPYDVVAQQGDLQNNAHGTTGLGVGTTHQREADHYHLHVRDLEFPSVVNTKLTLIGTYYLRAIHSSQIPSTADFVLAVDRLRNLECVEFSTHLPSGLQPTILESSQGILLDQDAGFFPHVTRSSVTATAAIDFLRATGSVYAWGSNAGDRIYAVTRAYQTRHGAGPMSNESLDFGSPISAPDETNVHNRYQGRFRRTPLDLDLLRYAVDQDHIIREHLTSNVTLVVTCLDHMKDKWILTVDGMPMQFTEEEQFLKQIHKAVPAVRVLLSHSPEGKMTTWSP